MTHRHRTTVGLQIPDFTYPDVPLDQLFERVANLAIAAEQSGFDTVFVMDHFFQLPLIGPPEREMFEAYTLLGALAARTSSVRLGTLVTGVTYRNPALLAKQVTALDVISRGRALLGIGAAWFDVEHEALGFRFPPVAERFEHLEDALQICRAMFTERRATVTGTHHSVSGAWNQPAPVAPSGPPIMIGGQGERKTFRLAAQYADELNCNAPFADLPRKLEALAGHLEAAGRGRGDIQVTCLGTAVVAATHDEAVARMERFLGARGVTDPAALIADQETFRQLVPRIVWGDPDEVAEQTRTLLDFGLDGVVMNLVADSGDLDAVALAGETLAKAVAGH